MNFSQAENITVSLTRTTTHEVFDALELFFTTRMHEDYEIIIEVISSDNSHNVLSAKRSLVVGEWYAVEVRFHQHQKLMYLQGLCTELISTGQYSNDSERQILTLRSELFPLFSNQRTGIYYGGSINDVIDRGLASLSREFHFNTHTNIEKKLTQEVDLAYPAQLSLTQYFESDMAFILRQLRQFGAWLNFYHPMALSDQVKPSDAQKVKITIGDQNASLMRYPDNIKILTHAESQGDGFYDTNYAQAGTAIGVVQGIYYDEVAGETLTCSATIPGGQGYRVLKYILPQTVLTTAQMQYQTQVVADSLSLRQQILSGAFQGLFIQAGMVVELEDDSDIAGEYIVSEVRYHFSKKANEKNKGLYQQNHRFKGYSLKFNYHEAMVDDQGLEPELYRAPKYQGVMPGIFALTQGSQTVVPDNLGSIPLWFPYNYWYTCQGQTCRYTRVISQANQGGRSGVSFPFYQDTEFVLMFVNGDLDRPVIKGAVANNLTGHLHNQSVQKRSALALPQGQHLLYSNVLGDQNFLKWGANHNEGSEETHMLLSNYPNPELPGTKKMDYQQASTQSYERVVNNNSYTQIGSTQHMGNDGASVMPKTYLLIQLGDQTNQSQPGNQPLLTDYLSSVIASITLNYADASQQLQNQTNDVKTKQAFIVLLANNADGAANLQSVVVMLGYKSSAGFSDAVNVIALNSKPMQPNDTLHLVSSDWQANKTTDEAGNTYLTIYLTLLPPPLLFNFRHSLYAANKALPDDQKALYDVAQQFFEETVAVGKVEETLPPEMLAFYKAQGGNALIFIHGFKVIYGAYPCRFVEQGDGSLKPQGNMSLCQSDAFIQSRFPGCTDAQLKNNNLRYGTGAQNWLMCMEYNLNKAFGFDDQDYSKYTRIIGVTWQGDPKPINYMAAVPMSDFAAQKVLGLIKQLRDAGIKVELMAHSLGNAVLAATLDLCSKNGIKIQHAHLWQPAIPENALNAGSANYLPILIPNSQGMEVNLPASYGYANAQNGAEKITVMFSDQDTILGPVSNQSPGDKTLSATEKDPGAGWSFAIPAAIIEFMDDHGIKFAGTSQGLSSIYHMANFFRYPLDYIFNGSEEDLVTYYNDWKNKFTSITLDENGVATTVLMAADIYAQSLFLFKKHPAVMTMAIGLLNEGLVVSNGVTEIERIKAKIEESTAVLQARLNQVYALPNGVVNLDWNVAPESILKMGKQAVLIATVLVNALLTADAVPPDAMGYGGIPVGQQSANYSAIDQSGYLQDHVAMLYPDEQVMDKVYKGKLAFGGEPFGIDYFGMWRSV